MDRVLAGGLLREGEFVNLPDLNSKNVDHPIVVNGKEYRNSTHAADALGVSHSFIWKMVKQLNNSKLNELTKTARVQKTFVFKKVK